MNKISFLLLTLITIGCVFVSCSDEKEQIEEIQRINEFKQRSQDLANQYGLTIMFSNEYIAERINWSYSQLEQEMQEISKSFLEIDSLGTNNGKKSLRPRMIGSYEIIQEIYIIDRDVNLQMNDGFNVLTFPIHIEWNSNFAPRGYVTKASGLCEVVHDCKPNCPWKNDPNHIVGTSNYDINDVKQKGNLMVGGYPSFNNNADVSLKLDVTISINADSTYCIKDQTFNVSVPYNTSSLYSANQ